MDKISKVLLFVSYPDESWQLAQELARDLEQLSMIADIEIEIFVAAQGIRPSEDWQDCIRQAIVRSKFLFFLWTKGSSCTVGQLVELGASWILERRRVAVCYGVSPNVLPPYLAGAQAVIWADRHEQLLDILRDLRRRVIVGSR